MRTEAALRTLSLPLVAGAAVLIAVALFAFEPLIALLEQYVSSDGQIKQSTRLLVEANLYAYAGAGLVVAAFCRALARPSFRTAVVRLLVYVPECPATPAPALVCRWLLVIVIVLLLVSVAGQLLLYVFGLGDTWPGFLLYRYFNLDQEHWVPTTFSSLMLLYSGWLLACVTYRKWRGGGRYVVHWGLLSLAFVYLASDEKFRLHEWMFAWLTPHMQLGLPVFWVAPAGILVLLGVLAYLGFLWHLPPRWRILFVVAGALDVGGAIGWEIGGRAYALEHGTASFAYEMLANIEEVFEKVGVVLFIYALQSYLQHMAGSARYAPTPAAVSPRPSSARAARE